jgi:hypothetical protein
LRAGSPLVGPTLTHGQLVAIAGNCLDRRHRLSPVCDDLLPEHAGDVAPSRARIATHATVVLLGLLLTGGAAYDVLPGELGHHGTRFVDVPGAERGGPAQHAVGGASSMELGGR